MNKDNFEKNGFIVDLGDAKDASEIINQLSNILEMPESQNKKICLKLGNVDLSKSQLLSVKALINSMNSELIMINSTSALTNTSAQSLNIEIAELTNKISIDLYKEAEKSENETEEVVEEEVSPVSEVEENKAEETEVVEDVEEIEEVLEQSEEDATEAETEVSEDVAEPIEEAPEVKIETRVVEEELPDEIIETQEEKVESNYELFNPEEEIEFESKSDAENKLSEMFGKQDEVGAETPEIKERKEKEQELSKLPTLYLQETLRSGQTMSYDGNVIIIGDVHPGSEIIAKGDITIWGVLGGIAHAGARGNNYAKIRALKMNAIQLRISGYYARRPDTFNIPYIQRTNEFTPEEARVEDEQIAIYKIYD